jgi:hypothetical protein
MHTQISSALYQQTTAAENDRGCWLWVDHCAAKVLPPLLLSQQLTHRT